MLGGLLLLAVGCGGDGGHNADVMVVGEVRTMNPAAPVAEAMVILAGKILYVGNVDDARAAYRARLEINLAPEQMAMPGLVDSHVHMLEGGLLQLGCPVEEPKTQEELFTALAGCIDDKPRREWFVGNGWPTSLFGERGPRKEELDALISDRPAVIYSEDGHSSWVNSAALDIADIGPQTEDPPNGRIERYEGTDEPSGTLRESAMDLVDEHIPPRRPQEYREALAIAQRMLHETGITLIQDAYVTPRFLEAYSNAARSGALTMKVVAAQATRPRGPASQVDELVALRDRFAHGHLTASTAKIFLDGVLEARTAALLEPYTGRDERGTLNWDDELLAEVATGLDAAGFQIHMHAIGDHAARQGLDTLDAVREANGASDGRHQMAHLELVDPAEIARFAELDVFANFQPFWMFRDNSIAEIEPLNGPERSARLYSIRSFEEAGARIVAGSDWTVSTPNPFLAI